MAYHTFHGLETRIVRIFNTYGPGCASTTAGCCPPSSDRPCGEDLTVFGDGSQTRSFCYVDDLVEGIYRLLLSDEHRSCQRGQPRRDQHRRLRRGNHRPDRDRPEGHLQAAAHGRPEATATGHCPRPRFSAGSRRWAAEGLAITYEYFKGPRRRTSARPNTRISPPTANERLVEHDGWFAHETAVIDDGCSIGAGSRIWHFSHIMPGAVLGNGCNIGQNVVISPDVVLGRNCKVQNNVSLYTGVTCEDDVFLGPSCVFTNVTNPRSAVVRRDQYARTRVGRGASIGANATIVCGHDIGDFAFIGAGAVVTKDVPAYASSSATARQDGWMSAFGHRLAFDADGMATCPESGSHIPSGMDASTPLNRHHEFTDLAPASARQGRHLAVIGLGYVGLPIALAFCPAHPRHRLRHPPGRVEQMKQGIDPAKSWTRRPLTGVTSPSRRTRPTSRRPVLVVAVPTPINATNCPTSRRSSRPPARWAMPCRRRLRRL